MSLDPNDTTLFDGAVEAACAAVEIPADDADSRYSMSIAVRAALRHIIKNTPDLKN